MKIAKPIKDGLKYHIVDGTALLTISNPIIAAQEVGIAGMSDEVSLKTRLFIAALTYSGLGYLFGKGRDLSRQVFGITDRTREGLQTLHDSLYVASFNIPLSIGLYNAAGEADSKKIAIGTALAVVYGAVAGPLCGYAVDAFRDMFEVRECERKSYPEFVRRQRPRVKRALATGLIAASIGTVGLIYSLTSDENALNNRQETTGQEMTYDFTKHEKNDSYGNK